jgi:hypothetical protein
MLERERDDLFEASVNCRVQKVKPVKHLETMRGATRRFVNHDQEVESDPTYISSLLDARPAQLRCACSATRYCMPLQIPLSSSRQKSAAVIPFKVVEHFATVRVLSAQV